MILTWKKFKLFLLTVPCVLIFSLFNGVTVFASDNAEYCTYIVEQSIPPEAKMIAKSNYQAMLNTILYNDEAFDVSKKDLFNVKIGKPFILYEDGLGQDEIYYFPLIQNGNVLMTLCVCGLTDGWGVSLGTEFVDILNELDYQNNDFLLYRKGTALVAQGNMKSYFFTDATDKICIMQGISNTDIISITSQLYEKNKALRKVNVKTKISNYSSDRLEMYAPSFSTSTSTSKVMALYNAQGQGDTPLCWAASVATIVNYIYGTSYTAQDVADSQEKSTSAGNIDDKQVALEYYGVTYRHKLECQLSYESIKKNVNIMRPVAVSSFNEAGGHAVTLYGYGGNYVYLWNSGNEKSQLVKYLSSGTVFPYNNSTFTWTASLSATE